MKNQDLFNQLQKKAYGQIASLGYDRVTCLSQYVLPEQVFEKQHVIHRDTKANSIMLISVNTRAESYELFSLIQP